MKNEYVLNHDYGYGKEPEQEELNKLELRNIEDLKVYVKDIMKNTFNASVRKNTLTFLDDMSKTEVVIERI